MDTSKLDVATRLVTMISSIAVPVTIGVIGWGVQRTIADQGFRKDYTDIAIQVLTRTDTDKQAELRQWAVDILDKNAPLPFSAKVREQLLGGSVLFTHQMDISVPDAFMEPPLGWIDPPKAGFSSDDAINKNYSENFIRAARNASTLKALQDTVRVYQDTARELEISQQHAESEYRKTLEDVRSQIP